MFTGFIPKRLVILVMGGGLATWGFLYPPRPGQIDNGLPAWELAGEGVIYYRSVLDPDGPMYRMNADGSGKARLPDGVNGEPSWGCHAGYRWFLTVREVDGPPHPNGSPRYELFSVRADGLTVQLTSEPDLEIAPLTVRWCADDAVVSWIARRRGPDGQVAEGGIYASPLRFDEHGNVAGLAETPIRPLLEIPLVRPVPWVPWRGKPVPDIWSFDWSPEGDAVVYESADHDLRVVKVQTGYTVRSFAGRGTEPAWSPDGSLIAFKHYEVLGRIMTVRPDGADLRILIGGQGAVSAPAWSPTGRHVAYLRCDATIGPVGAPVDVDAYCVEADGRRQINLTPDTTTFTMPVAWRRSSQPEIGQNDTPARTRRYAHRAESRE